MSTKAIKNQALTELKKIAETLISKPTQAFIVDVLKYAGVFMKEINELSKNDDKVTLATLKALNDRLLALCALEKTQDVELTAEEKERIFNEMVEIKATICDIQKKSAEDKWKPLKYVLTVLTVCEVSKLVLKHAPAIIKAFKNK